MAGNTEGVRRSRVVALVGGLIGLLGLVMAAGGGWLLSLGGSAYYLVAGAWLVLAGVALIWRYGTGLAAYLLFLAGTAAWAVWEVGLNGWLLLPRLGGPAVVLLLILMSAVFLPRQLSRPSRPHLRSVGALVASLGLFIAAVTGSAHWRAETAQAEPAAAEPRPAEAQDWQAWGASPRGNRFSSATQIDPGNVASLQVAWTYRTGETPADPAVRAKYRFEATPLNIGDTLYLCTPNNRVVALDAETGKERWTFDPKVPIGSGWSTACRGVSYWADTRAQPGAACARRIITATRDARLIALDAATGRPCAGFGVQGQVDLKPGLGEVKHDYYYVTSPPAVVRDRLILGGWVADNQSVDEPSGVIRAFDARSGQLVWNFDSGNPDETMPLPAGRTYTRASPNSWAPASVDEALGLVYLPTGNAQPDLWGGNRTPAMERFSSAIVALDVETGKLRWVYQTLHHDLWDLDVPSQPVIADIRKDGQVIPALFAPTKRGDIFVLDRRTGTPIVPAPERPVPQGAAPGDWTSKTQPFSELSFAQRKWRESDMWGVSPLDQLWCRIQFRRADYQGPYQPQRLVPTIHNPGSYGVFNWGSAAVDEGRQLAVINASYAAYVNQLVPREKARGLKTIRPMEGTPFAAVGKAFLSPLGIPCQAPPWGELAAVDLTTGKVAWRRPFGTTRDHAPFGLSLPLGMPSMGGPAMTATGLAFIGAASDDYIRAYAVATGRELWKARLPAGGQATPMTYVSQASGRQFVVISAGGYVPLKTTPGDYVVAYALPKPKS